jgi:hypothetical protein
MPEPFLPERLVIGDKMRRLPRVLLCFRDTPRDRGTEGELLLISSRGAGNTAANAGGGGPFTGAGDGDEGSGGPLTGAT